ncbi:MAG: hypothetical protein JW760_02070, partial [Spirochaetales bacterium]|nr:hypothetical protein [Spirochaetales bacterium]
MQRYGFFIILSFVAMKEQGGLPKVLIPFSKADYLSGAGDVVLYLRPETNGVLAESILFRTLRDHPAYGKGITLVYLANIPGEFMVSQGVLEDHYRHKLEFAYHG